MVENIGSCAHCKDFRSEGKKIASLRQSQGHRSSYWVQIEAGGQQCQKQH